MLCPTGRAALVLVLLLCGLPAALRAGPLEAIDSLQVRTGALYLHRSDRGSDEVLVRGSGSQPVLSTSDIASADDAGWELSLIGRLREEFALEVRFFALGNIEDSARLTPDAGGLGFAINDSVLGLLNGTPPVVADIRYETGLYSIEFNERWRMSEDVEFLLGLRHFQHKETLEGRFFDSTTSNVMRFEADNFLSGVQVGLDACLWRHNRFRIEGQARLGVYHNIVRTRYDLRADDGTTTLREWTSDEKNAFSLLGELQLTGVYQISDRVALRGGYQLLFLTDIATAPSQIAGTRTALNGGPTRIGTRADDTPIYHGLTAQIEIWLY